MAKQHLYSRVPAKVSMYNRSDGFDTFAHSAGLTREFVERELSAVYENKLSKNDAEAVRKGQMPLVYSQCCLRSGDLTQTCTSYLPLDYTGERSAYLSHTLILTDEERELLLHNKENAPFNPQMFITDISRFDFVSPSAAPDSCYPETVYKPCPVGDTRELVKRYHSETLKHFIFAVFSVLCAKGKTVYFKLDCPDAEVSQEALKLISSVMTVVPYHLRKHLPFVTYITDPAQYAFAKLKCMSSYCPEVHSTKGVFFDFHTDLTIGLPSDDIMANVPSAFFYSLLEDAAIRNEFLLFMDTAVKTMPALEKLSFKTLSDMVFLFLGSSGLFAQQEILPTDIKVYDFLCVYEKYRSTLSEECRRNAYKCLERYPERHEAIPKNIFTKLSRLYPNEPDSVKRVAMNSVLELIHTDIMRDKLFTFVKNNYGSEDKDIRATIHADLCRVFYGGFLQPQILSFFSEHFASETEETQNAVFEKLMLTIRTEAIQQKILEFIGANYDCLSATQKQLFYHTFFEMLPECDHLSSLLIDLVNGHITDESDERKELCRQKIKELLKADERKAEHKLMPLLYENKGFCRDTVRRLMFGEWNTHKIYSEYIDLLSQKTVPQKAEELLQAFKIVSFMDENVKERLMQSLQRLFAEDTPHANLYEWLEADRLVDSQRSASQLATFFKTNIIQPAVVMSLTDVFDVRLCSKGMEIVLDYVKTNPYLLDTKPYKILQLFLRLDKAIENKDTKTVFQCLSVLVKEPARKNMAEYIRFILSGKTDADVGQFILYQVSSSVLENDRLLPETVYSEGKDMYMRQIMQTQGAKANVVKAAREAAYRSAEQLLRVLSVACHTNPVFFEMVDADKTALESFLTECYTDYGKGADKWIVSCLVDAPADLSTAVKQSLNHTKPKSTGLLTKLFAKKVEDIS